MKTNREFDMLENADDKTLELLSEVPVLTKEEKERMLAMSKKKLDRMNRESNINFNNNGYEVSGVERYRRPKWHRIATVAACMLLIGGIGGTIHTLSRNKANLNTNDPLASSTVATVASTNDMETTCMKEADNLLAQYRFVMGLSYGIPENMKLDKNDTQSVEDYDGSTVTYYSVADIFSSVDELNSYLETIMTGNILNDYKALLTRYLGTEPRFKEIDGKLYFREGGGSVPEYNDYTIENCDGSSFDIVTVDAHSSMMEKEILHVVLENGLWKISSVSVNTAMPEQEAQIAPTQFDNTATMQLLSSFELVEDFMAGGIYTSVDKDDSIEYKSPDGSYTVIYNKFVSGGILDLNNLKEIVKSTVTEPVLSRDYSFIYEDKGNDLPVFKEIDGKLYMRDNARGSRFHFTGTPELIDRGGNTFDIITDNEVPGGTEKVKITAVFEDGFWKVSDFGYPDAEPSTAVSADISDSGLRDIAKEAPGKVNDLLNVENGTVKTDASDYLDNDTIYKYCGMTNPGNISYERVSDARFSSLEDIKNYISDRATGAFRDALINVCESSGNAVGFPVYIENDKNGKLYARISRYGGFEFNDDAVITESTDTTATVHVSFKEEAMDGMDIYLALENGKWKISGYAYV